MVKKLLKDNFFDNTPIHGTAWLISFPDPASNIK
jgi:hypothetical protein